MSTDLVAVAGALSRPAELLIEKIGSGLGALYEPSRIRRKARAEGYAMETAAEAEARAELIRTASQIEIGELQERALTRLLAEESKKQANIESVTTKALPLLEDDANPTAMDDDWIAHFFDSGRNVSNEEMQVLWARVLAGEANAPGSVSRRAVSLLSSLSKDEAELFTVLCRFSGITTAPQPFVYETKDSQGSIYAKHGINFEGLAHLNSIGLIQWDGLQRFNISTTNREVAVSYFGRITHFRLPGESGWKFHLGSVLFTKAGAQLAPATRAKDLPEFYPFLLQKWAELGMEPTPITE